MATIFFVATGALWLMLFTTDRLVQRDAYYFAQLGRQIRLGHGYTSGQIFPRYIPYFQERGFLHDGEWPSLHRYPVAPTVAALFQLLLSDEIVAGAAQSGIFFLLSVPLFFLLAARLTSLHVATLASVFFIGCPQVWRSSFNGMTESSAIFVLLAIFLVGFHPATRAGRGGGWLLLGGLCGLAYLARTQLLILWPLCLVQALALARGYRLASVMRFLAAASLTVSPWLARNYLVTGNPFFSFLTSRALTAKSAVFSSGSIDLELHAPIEMSAVLQAYGDQIAAKVWAHLWPNLVNPLFWWEMLGVYCLALPLALLGNLIRKPSLSGSFLLFERAALILVLANFFLVSTTYHKPRYYEAVTPFLIIILIARFWWLIGLLGRRATMARHRAAPIFFVLLLVLGAVRGLTTFIEHKTVPDRDPADRRSFEVLRQTLDAQAVIISDLSLEITLFTGRRTVRTPRDPLEVLEIDRDFIAIDAVVLSPRIRRRYRRLLESEAFRRRYGVREELPNGASFYRRSATVVPPGGVLASDPVR